MCSGRVRAHFHPYLGVRRDQVGLTGEWEGRLMQMSGRKVRGMLARATLLLLVAAGLAAAQEVSSSRKVVKSVSAQYPSVLKRRGIGGTVRMRVVVTPSGSVKDVQVLGGNPILADCAVKAVKQWTFITAEKEETVEVTVGFDPHSPTDEKLTRLALRSFGAPAPNDFCSSPFPNHHSYCR